jgi:hypothetical protein
MKERTMIFCQGLFHFHRRWLGKCLFLLILALVACGIAQRAQAAYDPGKIALRILYVGVPGSEREKDFLFFLKTHFQEAASADIGKFSEDQANNFDVILFDYEGDAFKAKRLRLSQAYKRATVTIGVYGSLMCGDLRLKTGYT